MENGRRRSNSGGSGATTMMMTGAGSRMNDLRTQVFLGAYQENGKQDASLVQKLRLHRCTVFQVLVLIRVPVRAGRVRLRCGLLH